MSLPRLFVISPGTLSRSEASTFAATTDGLGERPLALVLREPGLLDADYFGLAQALRERSRGMTLLLHDRPHLVEATRANGVHLGGRSLPPERAREQVRGWLGFSAHAEDDEREWESSDYLFFSPVRDTRKGGRTIPGIGFEALAAAVSRTERPVIALGGMRAEHVDRVTETGAHGLAVLSGVWSDPRGPLAAIDDYLEEFAT